MKLKATLTIALMALSSTSSAGEVFIDPDATVEYRQSGFQTIRTNFSVISAMIRGEREYDYQQLSSAADALKHASHLPWAGFEFAGHHYSGSGDAKHSLWENGSKFNDYKDSFVSAVHILAEEISTLDRGNAAAYRSSFVSVGRSCQQCHNDYRD